LPAAVEVSIGCSVALSEAPFAFTVRTMSSRSPMERARRSIRVTTSLSPLWRKSSTMRNSSRPAVVVPLRFSARMMSQPAAFNVAFWIDKS
jgi:hypothetical protein